MKTRYFKPGLLAATVALLYAASAVSCSADDIVVGQQIDEGAYGTIYENSVVLQDANTAKSNNPVELYGDYYETLLKLTLSKAPTATFTATAKFDAAYLQAYNAKHGTDYALYPQEFVTFANDGIFTIAANSVNATLGMMIGAAEKNLEEGKTYLVPVTITTQSADVTLKSETSHCVYLVQDMRHIPTCFKGEDLPKGFLFFEVNDANPLNTLVFQLEDGRLLWDAVVLFAANINYDSDTQRPFIKCNPNVQYLLDHNETFLQPLRKRGVKVLLGLLGNHDQAGLAQLSEIGARDFAAEVAHYCEAYNLDGVNYDDEYSDSPDLSNPAFTTPGTAAAARLCYETKKAMPDKLVTVFAYGYMYGTATVDGVDADEWIDIAVANYGSSARPLGNMTKKKCSGLSSEYNLGGGGNLSTSMANSLISNGYGWFMGFAPDPMKTEYNSNVIDKTHWQGIFDRLSGAETLYGSKLRNPTIFYKKNDATQYVYPDDLPDTK